MIERIKEMYYEVCEHKHYHRMKNYFAESSLQRFLEHYEAILRVPNTRYDIVKIFQENQIVVVYLKVKKDNVTIYRVADFFETENRRIVGHITLIQRETSVNLKKG